MEKANFLSQLDTKTYIQLRYFSDVMLRDNQIVEPGKWRYWLFIGGRGTGKTKTGASEIRKRVYNKQSGMCVIAPTHQDLIKYIVPAIQDEFPAKDRPEYIGGDKKFIKCHNGITIDCRTSQQGEIRGPNYTFIWLDELVNCWDSKPDKINDMFAILDASLRKGDAQILITTTGNNWTIFKRFYDESLKPDSMVVWKSGAMRENEYLSPTAVKVLEARYGNSRYANRELEGIIDWDVEGALWTPALNNKSRKVSIEEVANPPNPNNMRRYNNPMDFFLKFSIGADPATTSHSTSDAWGIVVCGLGRDHHLYVLEDASKILSPNDAANQIAHLHQKYRNAQIVAESNQGGDMITYILRTKLPNVQPKLIHAHQSKMTRAQPIVVLWDQGRAHLVGKFEELEREMCEYTGAPDQKSPNRLDAMVYACQWLLLEPNMRVPSDTWLPNFR